MIVDGLDRCIGIGLRATGQYEIFVKNPRPTNDVVRIAVSPVAAWKIAARLRLPITAEQIDA